jgi:hypothetical protein
MEGAGQSAVLLRRRLKTPRYRSHDFYLQQLEFMNTSGLRREMGPCERADAGYSSYLDIVAWNWQKEHSEPSFALISRTITPWPYPFSR